jgi:AAA+ ATPase superfamily predicted ATPase
MVGRKRELKILKGLLESNESEFAVLYGRRRIGKTYLVNEALGGDFAFHHAGLREGNTRKQLDSFRLSLRQQGYFACPRLKDWLEAFFELENFLAQSSKSRKVVFLDELPWMDTPKSGFLTALESFWNGWACLRKDIVLVACGSATSWVVRNIVRNSGGLYNRVRTRIRLQPFTLGECLEYANSELHLGYSKRDVAECYMALGGVAYYWSVLEKGKSPGQNFDTLFFGAEEGLRGEYDELYRSVFRHPDSYWKIVEALGGRRDGLTRDELLGKTGVTSNGTFSRCLSDLEECGFVRRYLPSSESCNGGVFQLVDNFTLFYRRFVLGRNERSGDYWRSVVAEGEKNEWRGFAFERLCLWHVPQIKAALGIAGVHAEAYSWRGTAQDGHQAQIDLVLDRKDGIVNVCEMKYGKKPYVIDANEAERLSRRVEAFRERFGSGRSVHLTMITSNGLEHNAYSHSVQSEVILDDLFRDA